jgi:hypothetical protein
LSPFLDLEGAIALKGFFTSFGCGFFTFQYEFSNLASDFRFLFLFTQSLDGIELCTIFLLVNTNLRLELPLLNSRLRKNYLNNSIAFKSYAIGFFNEFLGYPIISLGITNLSLLKFFFGRSDFFKCLLSSSYSFNLFLINYSKSNLKKNITIFLGNLALIQLSNSIYNLFLSSLRYLNNVFFYSLFDYLGRITMFELSFGIGKRLLFSKSDFIYSCCDQKNTNKTNFTVYHGSFFLDLIFRFNLYLPASFAIERQGFFLNCEGRYRLTREIIKISSAVYAD